MAANNTFLRFIRTQARAVKEQTTLYREPSTFYIRPNCPIEAVRYLDSQGRQGVTRCDIKDENILVDNSNVNVNLPADETR